MRSATFAALCCALLSACGRPAPGNDAAVVPYQPRAARATSLRASAHALPAGSQAAATLTTGPGGGIWYYDASERGVGVAQPGRPIVYYPTLGGRFGAADSPCQFVGSARRLWFAAATGSIVLLNGRGRAVAQYPLAGTPPGSPLVPQCLSIGSSGTLWFTTTGSRVGFVSRGKVTLLAGIGLPSKLAALPTGSDAYYCNADTLAHDVVVELGSGGTVAQFAMPARLDFCSAIVAGPDGNLWISDAYGGYIVRMTPNGKFTIYSLHAAFPKAVTVAGLTVGSDGNLWVAGSGSTGVTLARVSTSGSVTAYSLGMLPAPTAIAAGTGSIWLNAPNVAKIYSVATPR